MATLGGHEEPSLAKRIGIEVLSEPALHVGWEIGNLDAVDRQLDKLEAIIGPMFTGMAITSAGELFKVTGGVRQFLTSRGVNPLVAVAINGFVEQAVEGIRASRLQRGLKAEAPITEQDVKEGLKTVRQTIRAKAQEQQEAYMKTLEKLDAAKRASYLTHVEALSTQERAKYNLYIPDLSLDTSKWLVEELADLDHTRWIARLEAVFGEKKVPITTQIAKVVESAFSSATNALAVIPESERITAHQRRMAAIEQRAQRFTPQSNPNNASTNPIIRFLRRFS